MNGKENSRKWKLAKWSFWVLVALLVFSGLASLVLALCGTGYVLTLMSPDLFITGLGLTLGLYGAANVIQKKFTKPSDNEDEGDGFGGQPPESDNP
jgi:ABC-type uncharacterized transport system permease subunit